MHEDPYGVTISVFSKPLDELETEWYGLDVEVTTGYQSPLVDD